MKYRSLNIISVSLIAIISACGPAPEPTVSAEAIRDTAVAQAWIAMTQTQVAMPTATFTPVPPTFTPAPSITPFPTLQPVLPASGPAIGITPTLNPCYNPPPAKPVGLVVQVRLVNNSRGLVDLSLGMENPNNKGECATYYFRLGRYDQTVVSVLAACYWGYAYITDPTSNAQTIAPLCLYETTKTVPISIGAEVIGLQ